MNHPVEDLPQIGLALGGGTLTALAEDPFEVCDYGQLGAMDNDELLEGFRLAGRARIHPISFEPAPSFDMGPTQWRAFCASCAAAREANRGIEGFVLTHGTGSLEEAAFFLSLVWDLDVPLIVTGAQRPASAQSSDGPMNLFHALCAASDPRLVGRTVLVAVNGELHDPRDVTKASNTALDTFRSPWRGPVGRFTGAVLDVFARPTSFPDGGPIISWRNLSDLPRVDILYCHSDGDETAISAFASAGAKAIVIAGFPPGYATGRQAQALEEWSKAKGTVVVASSRAQGRVPENSRNSGHSFIASASLQPAKARILLQLAIELGHSAAEIAVLFDKVGRE